MTNGKSQRDIDIEMCGHELTVYPKPMNQIPALIIRLTDDSKIKRLLIDHGRTAALEPRPEEPGPMRLHALWGDGVLWYIVTHCYGYQDAADNGYIAYVIPQSTCAEPAFKEIADRLTHTGASGPDVIPLHLETHCASAN